MGLFVSVRSCADMDELYRQPTLQLQESTLEGGGDADNHQLTVNSSTFLPTCSMIWNDCCHHHTSSECSLTESAAATAPALWH